MIEEAIYSLVTKNRTITTLIGQRFYPNVIPQTADLPAVAYQVISAGRNYHHGGQSSLVTPVIGFTIDARNYSEAKAVAAAMRLALSGYQGYVDSVKIESIFLQNEFEGYNPASEIHLVRQDYQITWKEV